MRGASAAKRAFDLRCLDVRVEAKGNSLRSLPSSGALRHLLPQAGEGLGWPGFARGPRIGENGGPARAFGCLTRQRRPPAARPAAGLSSHARTPHESPRIPGETITEAHTSELQSLIRHPYSVVCLRKKNKTKRQ